MRLPGGMLLAMGDDMAFNPGYIQSVLLVSKLSGLGLKRS